MFNILTYIAHMSAFFSVATLGLLIGKFSFAPHTSWRLIIAVWVACSLTVNLYEKIFISKIKAGSTWWSTRIGLVTALLMDGAGVVTGVVFLVHMFGRLNISLRELFGSYVMFLIVIKFIGFSIYEYSR